MNYLGDADSVGSVTGQLAGAWYGWSSISPKALQYLELWGDGRVEGLGVLLAAKSGAVEGVALQG